MHDYEHYIELVRKAKLGDKECLNRLAEAARLPLRQYVLRLTLQEDLTHDIVQESILEMFKVFEKLKRAENFWPWLYGIAFNKVRSHYGRQWRHKVVSLSHTGHEATRKDSHDALADVVSQELKQIILRSMRELEPRHRAVLTMRCYDEMAYSDIAKLMGCTELGVRALFYRAKKALAKKLSRYGLGKSALLVALVLFGKMTAASEAAAASVSVSASTVKVGAAASLAAIATSKIGVLSIATTGLIAAGTVAIAPRSDKPDVTLQEEKAGSLFNAPPQISTGESIQECWYYYPPSANGVVMMRLKSNAEDGQSYCQWLQNDQANYYRRKNTIYISDYRVWAADLSVQRLPTDSSQLREFLSQVEGEPYAMQYVANDGAGLLVVLKYDENGDCSQIAHRYDVSDEEYFRYTWPAGARIIDKRDSMHKRGWTYFKAVGHIDGQEVRGMGRLPFVYATSKLRYPWLRLHLADGLKIVDSGADASVFDAGGKVLARYKGGSFFRGMGRPWMGLHTIDNVRRDAAEKRVRFETKRLSDTGKSEVVLTLEKAQLVYIINMEADVIESITFSASRGGRAELNFSYLQDVDDVGSDFSPPKIWASQGTQRDDPETFWLVKLFRREW